jgi:hypothetical protein
VTAAPLGGDRHPPGGLTCCACHAALLMSTRTHLATRHGNPARPAGSYVAFPPTGRFGPQGSAVGTQRPNAVPAAFDVGHHEYNARELRKRRTSASPGIVRSGQGTTAPAPDPTVRWWSSWVTMSRARPNLLTMSAGVVNPLSAAMRIADDCGHGHDPTSRHVHRGRQAV